VAHSISSHGRPTADDRGRNDDRRKTLIGVGSIQNGPEVGLTAASGAVGRLADLFEPGQPEDGTYSLVLVFEIPGSLGASTYTGARVGYVDWAQCIIQMAIAVPEEVAASSAPDLALVDLAEQAVERAAATLARRGERLDLAGCQAALDRAREEIERSGPVGARPPTEAELEEERVLAQMAEELGIPPNPPSSRLQPTEPVVKDRSSTHLRPGEPAAETSEITVIVTLAIPNKAAVDAAFALEDALVEQLERDGIGYVDGNEIGGGEMSIFCFGDDAEALHSMIEEIVRSMWHHPGAVIRATNGEDDVSPGA
jgi:hypothetical protein